MAFIQSTPPSFNQPRTWGPLITRDQHRGPTYVSNRAICCMRVRTLVLSHVHTRCQYPCHSSSSASAHVLPVTYHHNHPLGNPHNRPSQLHTSTLPTPGCPGLVTTLWRQRNSLPHASGPLPSIFSSSFGSVISAYGDPIIKYPRLHRLFWRWDLLPTGQGPPKCHLNPRQHISCVFHWSPNCQGPSSPPASPDRLVTSSGPGG